MTKAEHITIIENLPTFVSREDPVLIDETENVKTYAMIVEYSDGVRTPVFQIVDEGEETEQVLV